MPSVNIFPTLKDLGEKLCFDIKTAASQAIQEKDAFYLAVPGGSALKLLSGLTNPDNGPQVAWDKVFLFYVNHKCVPMSDPSATHFKATGIFIDDLMIPSKHVFDLRDDGTVTKGHDTDRNAYEKNMLASGIPVSKLV